jgi:DNA ligase 1
MLFSEFASVLVRLEQTSSRLEMTRILSRFFEKTNSEEIDKAVYLLQGRIGPKYESCEFGLAEKLVFKAFVAAFSINESQARKRYKQVGDLGKTAEEFRQVNRSLFETGKPLSLLAVFSELEKLAKQAGTGSQETKLSILANLFQQLDSLSCRYLVRIVLAKLRLGFSEMTILDALSWYLNQDKSMRSRIETAYNVRPDLGLIAKVVRSNKLDSLGKLKPQPGVPILMARAERVGSAAEVIKKIGPCAIESKYDGFRLQLHKLPSGEVKIFSRNLDNIVHMFPDLVLAIKKEIKADSCIFEAEAVGYHPKTRQILPFQEIVQRKRKYEIEAKIKEVPLMLFAFDLLYQDGRSYLEEPYLERRLALKGVISSKGKTVSLAVEKLVTKAEQIETLFQKAVSGGMEGIMAKKLQGHYQAGARGYNWIKFKHSYAAKLVDTIDCLVMGFDYGKGKRTAFGIGAFLVGVLVADKDEFVTVAKIGTGLTDEEWRHIKKQSQSLVSKTKPKNYLTNKASQCDVWLKPGLVVEIRADEMSQSSVHTAKLGLRFPRLERFRADKTPQQTTTLSEIKKLYQLQHKATLA